MSGVLTYWIDQGPVAPVTGLDVPAPGVLMHRRIWAAARQRPARGAAVSAQVATDFSGSEALGYPRPVLVAASTRQDTCARSSTDRASDYGSEGLGFESLRARQSCRTSEAVSALRGDGLLVVHIVSPEPASHRRLSDTRDPAGPASRAPFGHPRRPAAAARPQSGSRLAGWRAIVLSAAQPGQYGEDPSVVVGGGMQVQLGHDPGDVAFDGA